MIQSYNVYLPQAQVVPPKPAFANGLSITNSKTPAIAANTNTAPASASNKTAIRKAAEDFEGMFITEMLRPMFEQNQDEVDPMFGGSHGEEMFKSLMTDEYGKAIAQAGGVGIADSIEAQMLKYQEVK